MSRKTIELNDETKRKIRRSHQDFRQGAYQHLHRDGDDCPECGGTTEEAWNYCGWCGADLTNTGETDND